MYNPPATIEKQAKLSEQEKQVDKQRKAPGKRPRGFEPVQPAERTGFRLLSLFIRLTY
jgi:hypothetical protein